jgi:serine/threonine protein kinase
VTAKDDIGQTKSRGAHLPSGSYGLNAPPGADVPGVESLRPGMQLNGVYEIDALLARGGMGEVYKGHSIQTGDAVAIKVIRADLAENEVAIALFRNEASKLYRLHNEAIIRYFLFSVDPLLQRTYLAMEFVEGEPLSHMLRRGPLPVESIQRLSQRVALGLSAAHKRDIIHRDVSSDNIIIQNGDVDEAKIIDFGIARSTQAGTTLIDVGFAGKLNYVSPEQLGLFGGDVTARSDIYSLGLVLLEAARGAPADMGGTQVEVIEKRKGVPSLAGVDPRIRPILEKMLQPDPNDRQPSMQAVADDFARLPITAPASARPQPSRREARPRPSAKRRTLWIGAAGALIALSGGIYMWLATPTKKAVAPPEVALHPPPEQKPAGGEPQAPALNPLAPAALTPPALTTPDLSSGVVTREGVLRFVGDYAGAPCFSIVSAAATASSAKIEGIGDSRKAFDELNAAFQKTVGFDADIQAVLVPSMECAALDFYNRAKAHAPLAPQVALDTPFLRAGQPLTGSIASAKDRTVEALLVDDDGLVRNVTNALAGRSHAFSINVARPKAAGRPQLLAFVSSAQPLSALKLTKPVKAAEAFDAATAEAEENQEQLGVALRYFYVAE